MPHLSLRRLRTVHWWRTGRQQSAERSSPAPTSCRSLLLDQDAGSSVKDRNQIISTKAQNQDWVQLCNGNWIWFWNYAITIMDFELMRNQWRNVFVVIFFIKSVWTNISEKSLQCTCLQTFTPVIKMSSYFELTITSGYEWMLDYLEARQETKYLFAYHKYQSTGIGIV